jgi:Mediator complex protein
MTDPSSSPAASKPADQTFSPAERITELNTIDDSISSLLSSASTAVGILSNSPSCAPEPPPTGLSDAQEQLTNVLDTFFKTLSTIDVGLRRQIYALEEAGLLEAGDERDTRRGRALGSDGVVRTGGGPLDPSWLNARANNGVETGLEKELLQDLKAFLVRK